VSQNWTDNLVEFQKLKLEANTSHWDSESLEFCIALKTRDIGLLLNISENLSVPAKQALGTRLLFPENKDKLDVMTNSYFKTYLNSDARGIGEFWCLFLRDDEKTVERFKSSQSSLFPMPKTLKEVTTEHSEIITHFFDESAQTRYFKEKEIWIYYFSAFCARCRDFKKDTVQQGFEYFLNVSCPMSQKFYNSGYAEYKTGLQDTEEAIVNLCKQNTTISEFRVKNNRYSLLSIWQYFKQTLFEAILLSFLTKFFSKKPHQTKDKD